jgi:hypothetical protein
MLGWASGADVLVANERRERREERRKVENIYHFLPSPTTTLTISH